MTGSRKSIDARKNLDRFVIPAPCPVALEPIRSTQSTRLCEHCQKEVHHIAAMTRDEIGQLAEKARDGGVCVQIRRRGGRLVTAETEGRFAERRMGRRGFISTTLASWISLLSLLAVAVVCLLRLGRLPARRPDEVMGGPDEVMGGAVLAGDEDWIEGGEVDAFDGDIVSGPH